MNNYGQSHEFFLLRCLFCSNIKTTCDDARWMGLSDKGGVGVASLATTGRQAELTLLEWSDQPTGEGAKSSGEATLSGERGGGDEEPKRRLRSYGSGLTNYSPRQLHYPAPLSF
ncbi:hypothetical protein MLD38_034848 [Melastoma candidum]|uniref:Uncharacterized protein n=1 Tax=Melastoma candidum TaxID=119954 RepID=A0ACB9MBC8_9MYRT|nr:hypothetical protein MLD38_034848 [Melastoma candidum]